MRGSSSTSWTARTSTRSRGSTPAIAIDQRPGSLNPRSTVATATEIHDYLRVLWAAAGTPHDPETGERLVRMSSAEIVASLCEREEKTRVILLAPLEREDWEDAGAFAG
jgi:excinuclease ABC subunit A